MTTRLSLPVEDSNVFEEQGGDISKDESLGSSCHKCSHCSEVFTRPSSVKRHICKKHKAERGENNGETEDHCLCLHCGFKCRRIGDLRKHLSKGTFFWAYSGIGIPRMFRIILTFRARVD